MENKMTSDAAIKHKFASAVRLRRRHLGISQEALAERAGLHRTYVSDVERGARNLSLESISKLAHALDVSISTLFPASDAAHPATRTLTPSTSVEILLVEDDPNDVELALRVFKRARFSNAVYVVRDGVEALDYVFCRGAYVQHRRNGHAQVILMDLNLPKLNGLEVLRRIKADKSKRNIPVVILTGSLRSEDVNEWRRLGADSYIIKPLDFHRLSQVTPSLNLDWSLVKPAATDGD